MLVGAAGGYDLGWQVVITDVFHSCGHYSRLVVLSIYLWILTLHLELRLEFDCVFIFVRHLTVIYYVDGLVLMAPGVVEKLRGRFLTHTEFFEAGRV